MRFKFHLRGSVGRERKISCVMSSERKSHNPRSRLRTVSTSPIRPIWLGVMNESSLVSERGERKGTLGTRKTSQVKVDLPPRSFSSFFSFKSFFSRKAMEERPENESVSRDHVCTTKERESGVSSQVSSPNFGPRTSFWFGPPNFSLHSTLRRKNTAEILTLAEERGR